MISGRRASSQSAASVREEMERALARALTRAPCLVSFSGGRDSSALLSLAVHVARREGLNLPVPATLVFPGSRDADESEWQDLVLMHLGVTDRIRIDVHEELDAVGPVAGPALSRHGLLWPFNAHFHLPIIERASGGSVVTGFGGDELGRASASARAEQVLALERRPRRSDLSAVGFALSPRVVRTAVEYRRARGELAKLPWLTRAGVARVASALATLRATAPLGWESRLRQRFWRDRYFRVCIGSFKVLADYHDVAMVHPFVEEDVLDALASAGGFRGFGSRSQLMAALFGDLLPATVVERATKGAFSDPLWTATARRFAEAWSGDGVDEELVDPEVLRRHWLSDDRNLLSTTLLQHAWLHDHPPGCSGLLP